MNQLKNKLVFVPYVAHLNSLFDVLINQTPMFFVADESAKVYIQKKHLQSVLFTSVHFFHFDKLRYWLNIQTNFPLVAKNLDSLLRKNDITKVIVFDFYHWYTLQAIGYKKKHPEVKLIIYSETKRWPQSWLSRVVMRCFLRYIQRNEQHIDGVLVYTEEGKRWWQEHVPALRVSVLPAPVDVEMFRPVTHKDWLPNEKLRILMNARYNPYKRHEDLFRALRELRVRGRQARVTLIGRDDGGRVRVEALAREYGVGEWVTFIDPLPMSAMPALYHAHDVLVLPSYNEAIGMVVPEAMACGLPTITSDTVGANVYVQDGVTGYVFPTGDVTALVDRLEQCFDKQMLSVMSEAGRRHIESSFTPEQIAAQFLEFLTVHT